jgi:hypothetical protein
MKNGDLELEKTKKAWSENRVLQIPTRIILFLSPLIAAYLGIYPLVNIQKAIEHGHL